MRRCDAADVTAAGLGGSGGTASAALNPQLTAVAFLGGGGGDWEARMAEWESGETVRQSSALLLHGRAVAAQLEASYRALHAAMAADEREAREALEATQRAITLEESRIFKALRADATGDA